MLQQLLLGGELGGAATLGTQVLLTLVEAANVLAEVGFEIEPARTELIGTVKRFSGLSMQQTVFLQEGFAAKLSVTFITTEYFLLLIGFRFNMFCCFVLM